MWEPQFNGDRVPYGGDENVLELGMLQWLHNIVNVLSPMENFMVYVFYHNGKIKYKNFFFFQRFHLFILERRREGEWEGEKHQCVFASHVSLVGDLAWNPGKCPDWESNWRCFGSQTSTQSTEPHQPGLKISKKKKRKEKENWHPRFVQFVYFYRAWLTWVLSTISWDKTEHKLMWNMSYV